MQKRVVLVGCIVALALLLAPTGSAKTQRSDGFVASLATSVVGDLAKQGVKAGIGYLAPDMAKYTDPTAYQLGQIQAQLDNIQNSLNNLSAAVDNLQLGLDCKDERNRVEPIVQTVIATEKALKNATLAPTESGKKARLEQEVFPGIIRLNNEGAQGVLHGALIGTTGQSLITACARLIEAKNGPVLTPRFSKSVESFYERYAMTEATLLMLRVNYFHYFPDRYAEPEIQGYVTTVSRDLEQEAKLIKPEVPWWAILDTRTGMVWEYRLSPVSHLYASTYHNQGYKLSGWDQTPTCGDIVALVTGFSGGVLETLGIVPQKVRCHNGYDGVIDLATKNGGNNGLDFNQLGRLPGWAAKPYDVKAYSYR